MRLAPSLVAALVAGLAAALSLAPELRAQTLPQLYDVSGVAAGDVLNIRATPSASAEIIGTLAPNAQGVEVVAANSAGTWGQVNTGEAAGWVSLRYMAPRGVHIDNFNLPHGLFCFGTEPFWSLQNIGGALNFDTPDEAARDFDLWMAQDSGIAEDLRRMVQFAGFGGPGMAFIYPAACNDGMSDRAYGLAISLMTAPTGAMLNGCCSLSR